MFDLVLITILVLRVLICFLIMIIIAALLGTMAVFLIDVVLEDNNKGSDYNDSDKR